MTVKLPNRNTINPTKKPLPYAYAHTHMHPRTLTLPLCRIQGIVIVLEITRCSIVSMDEKYLDIKLRVLITACSHTDVYVLVYSS